MTPEQLAGSDLVHRKREGAEKMLLAAAEIAQHDGILDSLEARLAEAHEASTLPDEPATKAALEDLVIRLRLATERHDAR
jgi:hypothetical protein